MQKPPHGYAIGVKLHTNLAMPFFCHSNRFWSWVGRNQ